MKYKRYIATGVLAVSFLANTGFILSVKNLKAKKMSSMDVATNSSTIYEKDGISASTADLLEGQKVIVVGALDKNANILVAKNVKIITNNKNL